MVYADRSVVKTRWWVWRQGDDSKAVESSRLVFPVGQVLGKVCFGTDGPALLGGRVMTGLLCPERPECYFITCP